MEITAVRRRASNWNIKVFERTQANRYLLHEENIQEASFPMHQIDSALQVHFRRVTIIDNRSQASFSGITEAVLRL